MTTEVRTGEWVCLHDPAAVCWLCSDQVPWWREARIRKGLPAEPRAAYVEEPVSVAPVLRRPRPDVTDDEVEEYWLDHTEMTWHEARVALVQERLIEGRNTA